MLQKLSATRRPGRLRQFRTVAGFMTPAWLGLLVFFVYPLVATVWFSLNQFDLFSAPRWFGLGNFAYMFVDANLHKAAANTLWLVVVLVPVKVVAALVVALLLARLRRSASIWRTMFYLPALVPPVAATVAFVFLFNPGTGAGQHRAELDRDRRAAVVQRPEPGQALARAARAVGARRRDDHPARRAAGRAGGAVRGGRARRRRRRGRGCGTSRCRISRRC